VKISTIFSQIHLLAFQETVDALAQRLAILYRAAIAHSIPSSDGHSRPKFINLDMEEYRDLRLTVAAFRQTLDQPEFQSYSAGIVLQAYLPDSHHFQKELTEWAKHRVAQGGAPIKIRVVKGANLAMEQFEASLRGWPQAPYTAKVEVDANYKRMVIYGSIPENARAVRLGVASHNLFDLAFAMLLRLENEVEPYVGFEMLEGMAEPLRRVVQSLTGDILLYCPIATREEFQHAIAYLIRRLDENTGPENFLRHAFGLKPGTEAWEAQVALFSESCEEIESAPSSPRRTQNRQLHPQTPEMIVFENEPDTDFSLLQNQKWAEEIACHWRAYQPKPLPLMIGGKEIYDNEDGIGCNPSEGGKPYFRYAKAKHHHIDQALACAKAHEAQWASTSLEHRAHLLRQVAQKLRERRGELIGVMMLDGAKTILEGDPEVSEGIDFAEYYQRQMGKLAAMKDLCWRPKGTVLVAPPWNFPCSIPAGGVLAALMTGNCVLLKPASDAVLVAWHLVQAMWDAGIPKEVLQFIPCSGEEVGDELVRDSRVNCIILTGGTATAQHFLKIRPGVDMAAETGGKNAIIITALSDRDLAIKDLIQSAFGHSGQKCSAASLAILEAEVYDDPHFLHTLRDATASLKVGLPWDLGARISPLIHAPRGSLKRALTTLEPGEEWLLEPRQDPQNPCLWTPGIKLHVKPHSFTHVTELFGPVLGLMRARDLSHAIEIDNATPYGLTAGLHSLDKREQHHWIEGIEAGNLYINRTITGAIVRRQPFGGTKLSSFGNGSKAGGPNYLRELLHVTQVALPQEKLAVNEWVNNLTSFLDRLSLDAEELGLWTASICNYAYWWKRLQQDRDPTKIVGQDNFLRYVPRKGVVLRLSAHSRSFDALRVAAAALTVGSPLEISWATPPHIKPTPFNWLDLVPFLRVVEEEERSFLNRVRAGQMQRLRLLESPSQELCQAAAEANIHIVDAPVLANGRIELLHYLREVSLSIDYHRYGNLGLREGELRKPIQ
jgi:RHH-type proline utilization regulon transcriptional repressor/proline dehydrogenase/delta 1-pyrroline-5-carboxylate dehydrogenase